MYDIIGEFVIGNRIKNTRFSTRNKLREKLNVKIDTVRRTIISPVDLNYLCTRRFEI